MDSSSSRRWSRRAFLHTAAGATAGSAWLGSAAAAAASGPLVPQPAAAPHASAQDQGPLAPAPLVLRGGRVIDPAQEIDSLLDVRIRNGRIDALQPSLPADDATVLDVRDLLVVPGLIDAHVHCFRGLGTTSLDPDLLGVQSGATTVVDAGSAGASTFPLFHDYVMPAARTRVLAFLNLSVMGSVAVGFASLGDPRLLDPNGIARTVATYRDRIVGIKVVATNGNFGPLGLEPLRRGAALAEELDLPLMVHVGESFSELPPLGIEEIVALLRPGDVLTHVYTAQQGGLLDANGRLPPAVREARDRGVRFDIGHGANNFSFDVAQRLLDQSFLPDAVSSDLSDFSVRGPVYNLTTTMAKLLAVGLPLRTVVASVTSQPAEMLGRSDELGSLAVGRVADITVLRLAEREWTATDSPGERRVVRQQFEPVHTIRAGAVIQPRPPEGP